LEAFVQDCRGGGGGDEAWLDETPERDAIQEGATTWLKNKSPPPPPSGQMVTIEKVLVTT
jgi:hypothetical protein